MNKMKKSTLASIILLAFAILSILDLTNTIPKLLSIRSDHRKRTFHTTTARRCEGTDHPSSPADIRPGLFKSQSGEDAELMKWFGGLCHGSYIEMGGLDGVLFSNSHVFNKALGWRGVLVEIIPSNFNKMVANRPNEIANVHAGVCNSPRTLHYFDNPPTAELGKKHAGAVSGIYEFASPSFRGRWWHNSTLEDTHEIECDTLDNLLRKHVPKRTFFDFFSLDVEGAELSVLESTDFDRVGFGVIFVEADQHNDLKNLAVRATLEEAGYFYLRNVSRSEWYLNRQFHFIYKDLIY